MSGLSPTNRQNCPCAKQSQFPADKCSQTEPWDFQQKGLIFNSGYMASGERKNVQLPSPISFALSSCHLLLIYSTYCIDMAYLGAPVWSPERLQVSAGIFRTIHTHAPLPIIHNNDVLCAYPAAGCHLKPSAHAYFPDSLLLVSRTVHHQDALK